MIASRISSDTSPRRARSFVPRAPLHCTASVAGICASLIFLSSCAIGPDHTRPHFPLPEAFRNEPGPALPHSVADLPWWELYKDPVLTKLIRTALDNNYDARIAVARMEQARQSAAQTRSLFFPGIGYQGAASRGKNEDLGSPSPRNGVTTDTAFLAFNMAWELDIWGRIRRLDEAARAQYLASEEARNGVTLSLVSSMAQAYFELLELDLARDIAANATESFGKTYQLFARKLQGGAASKLDTSRAEAAMATAAAAIPDTERQIVLKENQICILLGQPPASIPRTAKLLEQTLQPEVPAGLPSTLLERRPDIRQAEQVLRAANAQIGVTMGAFLPQIGLTALAGKISPDLSQLALDAGRSSTWSLAGAATGPIFQGGNLLAQYRQAKAAWEEARLSYEQTVINALSDVAGALVAREKLDAVRFQQARAVSAYQEAVKVAIQRYSAGKASYFEVLDAQQQLFPAENALAQTQLNQLLAVVQLYKALGGGWKQVAQSERVEPRDGA
jgi:outer membrane protein, multidrug efflux system